MISSVATVALTFWLTLVTVACLHRIWRVATSQSVDRNASNRSSAGRDSNRDYRRSNLTAESVFHKLNRILGRALRVLKQAFIATLGHSVQWLSQKIHGRLAVPPLAAPTQSSNPIPVDFQLSTKGDVSEMSGAQPVSDARKEKEETKRRIATERQERRPTNSRRARRLTASPHLTADKSPFDHAEKKKAVRAPAGVAARTKSSKQPRRVRAVANPKLTPKASL
jgi:hypothetical protein